MGGGGRGEALQDSPASFPTFHFKLTLCLQPCSHRSPNPTQVTPFAPYPHRQYRMGILKGNSGVSSESGGLVGQRQEQRMPLGALKPGISLPFFQLYQYVGVVGRPPLLAPSLLPDGRDSGTLSDCLCMGVIFLNTPVTNTLPYSGLHNDQPKK